MTIRWIESKERMGGLIKEVLGPEVPDKGILYTTGQFHDDWPDHIVTVFAKGLDKVLIKGQERGFCGDCVPRNLERSEINNHPVTARQLRWIPSDSATELKPVSGARKALAFFRGR